jgi:D-arabinose 1-dehydrogenase-like Zn-dependent alcohol dehydrogenase
VRISGSLIGGMKETQECLDFCAAKNIKPSTQVNKKKVIPKKLEKCN